MIQRLGKMLVTGAVACSLSGCYTLQYSAHEMPDDSVSFTRNSQAKVERYVAVEERAVYVVNGLIPVFTPNVVQMLRREVGNKRVQAVRIKSQQTAADVFLGFGLGVVGAVVIGGAGGSNPQLASILGALWGLILPQFRTVSIDGEVISDEPVKPTPRK